MIKEAFLCGLGLVADISGMHYVTVQPQKFPLKDQTALYWTNVGSYIGRAVAVEKPTVEAAKRRQLELVLPNT
jgi:hypothetical protein